MKITMETDYAFRIMRCLARYGKLDSTSISEKIDAPQRFTVKILGKLVSGSVVTSRKGIGGGYELADLPENITLKKVFEIIEGPLTISRCSNDGNVCRRSGENGCDCFFNRIFDEINISIAEKLESVTIADSM